MLFDRSNPGMFWLDVMNVALGVAVAVGLMAVLYGVARDVLAGLRKRAASTVDRHAFASPELGVTMADGGEPEDSPEKRR